MTTEERRPPARTRSTAPGSDEQPERPRNGGSASSQSGGAQTIPAGPKISCVIPTFNGARFIRDAINSVIDQDYSVECIVIDAGSTDDTLKILESYGDKITWKSRPDRGAFDAINDGWKIGRGDILAWVNSDDMWEPGAARLAARYFSNHPEVDVLYGACGGIDAEGNLIADLPPREWDLHFALQNCDHIINQTASFVRRKMIEKVDYLYPAWCHDHDLWLRIAVHGGTFSTTTRRLGNARIWPANLGNNPGVIVPGKVGLTKRIFENPLLPESLRGMKDEAISNAYLRCIYYVNPIRPQNWPLAVRLFTRAVAAHPTNLAYLSGQVAAVAASRVLGVGPVRRLYYASRKIAGGVAWTARSLFRLGLWTYRSVSRMVRSLLPALAVAGAGGAVYEYDLDGLEAAQAFALVAGPLLLMAYIYDHRNR